MEDKEKYVQVELKEMKTFGLNEGTYAVNGQTIVCGPRGCLVHISADGKIQKVEPNYK